MKPRPMRPVGRPPAGNRPGEKVKDYPQVSLRLPTEIRDRLQRLSLLRSQPQWRIICEAIDCYFRQLPAEERRRVAVVAALPSNPRSPRQRQTP